MVGAEKLPPHRDQQETHLRSISIFTRAGQTIRFMQHDLDVIKCYDL